MGKRGDETRTRRMLRYNVLLGATVYGLKTVKKIAFFAARKLLRKVFDNQLRI